MILILVSSTEVRKPCNVDLLLAVTCVVPEDGGQVPRPSSVGHALGSIGRALGSHSQGLGANPGWHQIESLFLIPDQFTVCFLFFSFLFFFAYMT